MENRFLSAILNDLAGKVHGNPFLQENIFLSRAKSCPRNPRRRTGLYSDSISFCVEIGDFLHFLQAEPTSSKTDNVALQLGAILDNIEKFKQCFLF